MGFRTLFAQEPVQHETGAVEVLGSTDPRVIFKAEKHRPQSIPRRTSAFLLVEALCKKFT